MRMPIRLSLALAVAIVPMALATTPKVEATQVNQHCTGGATWMFTFAPMISNFGTYTRPWTARCTTVTVTTAPSISAPTTLASGTTSGTYTGGCLVSVVTGFRTSTSVMVGETVVLSAPSSAPDLAYAEVNVLNPNPLPDQTLMKQVPCFSETTANATLVNDTVL